MISINIAKLTHEDLAYCIISNTVIDFGYITNKERRSFFESLISNKVVVGVSNSNRYIVKCNFVYRTVKTKRTDDCVYVLHRRKRGEQVTKDKVERHGQEARARGKRLASQIEYAGVA